MTIIGTIKKIAKDIYTSVKETFNKWRSKPTGKTEDVITNTGKVFGYAAAYGVTILFTGLANLALTGFGVKKKVRWFHILSAYLALLALAERVGVYAGSYYRSLAWNIVESLKKSGAIA